MLRLRAALPLATIVAAAAAAAAAATGCGLLPSDDEAPLAGVYDSDEFRVRRTNGATDDVGDAGAELAMTLTGDGRVTDGRLAVPAGGTGAEETIVFTGTYERDGHRVTFTFDDDALTQDYFDTGTPLAEVPWQFYDENDGMLGADAQAYVIFLERRADAPEDQ